MMGRRLVTQADLDEFVRLREQGLTCREVAAEAGWSYGAVQDYLSGRRELPSHELHDPKKYQCSYESPTHRPNDERKHLQALYDANGYGFSWWPPSLMERVYRLEVSPPAGRPFWRAA